MKVSKNALWERDAGADGARLRGLAPPRAPASYREIRKAKVKTAGPEFVLGWMHVSSGFLLLETQPGRESAVLDQLARFHGVTHHSVIFPAAIAVRVENPAGVDAIAAQLRGLDGVMRTRLYRTRHN